MLAAFTKSEATSYHPIFDKFGPEHVSKFLEQSHESDTKSRWFRFAYVVLGISVFVLLTLYLLPSHDDLYFEMLEILGAFGAGVAGGYGIKAYQDQRRN